MKFVFLGLHPIEETANATPFATAFNYCLLIFSWQLIEGNGHRNFFRSTKLLQFRHGPLVLWLGPCFDCAFFQGESRVWNHQIQVEADGVAKPLASWTCAVGIIETEESRLRCRVDSAVVLAF